MLPCALLTPPPPPPSAPALPCRRRYADVIIPWQNQDNLVAIDLITEHIRLKLKQHDLLRIYPNLEVGAAHECCLLPAEEQCAAGSCSTSHHIPAALHATCAARVHVLAVCYLLPP